MTPGHMLLLLESTGALRGISEELKGVADVRWENHKALVCLVGENIRRQPEVASRAFAAVSDMDVRVLCQGASDGTISFLVEESKVEESVQRLHGAFFPHPEPAHDWGGIFQCVLPGGLTEHGLVTELGGFRYIRSRARQRLNDVQTTLGFSESRPTTGARIFSRANGARAMRAADTRVILIVSSL